MDAALQNMEAMVPALLFLCAGVPLASLLDRLGFFDAVAAVIEHRWQQIPVLVLWTLAAVTTAVLNLDTTIVLLTPLYVRLARRAGVDSMPLALVPLLLASFASSVLPVSNLTTLMATDRLDLSVAEVFTRLGIISLVACTVGWLVYQRRYPTVLVSNPVGPPDRRALRIGSLVVAGLLAGFVLGPTWGIQPWLLAVVADVVLIGLLRHVPWRDVPVLTALGVAAAGGLVSALAGLDALARLLDSDEPLSLGGVVLVSAAVANLVNNLPALLVGLETLDAMTAGGWAWLAGVNTGAVLLPFGALANLLWWRIVREEQVAVSLSTYVRSVIPIALPATVAAALAVALTSARW